MMYLALVLGVGGLVWIAVDSIRERRKLRAMSLSRLNGSGESEHQRAERLAEHLTTTTGFPHHVTLRRGHWRVESDPE